MLSDLYNYLTNLTEQNDSFVKIDSGEFRSVYRIETSKFGSQYNGCIIKIADESRSIGANKYEFQTWMTVKGTELEKYFCPILDRTDDYRILVMEYADKCEISNSKARQFEDEIKRQTSLTSCPKDLKFQISLDIRPKNIRMYNGRKVMVDYPWGGNFSR